jgi:cytochrome c553
MRFRLRTSARAVALGVCLAFSCAAQDGAEAQGDAKGGRVKAESVCAVCHGVDGLAKIPEAPNIAGQNEAYLIEQLTAFKSGERKNEMMSVVVQDLSDADIENLAAY